jgi:hypothetical protein
VAGVFAIRLKDEMKASISTKADWTTASRLAALAQAMTVLACDGYMRSTAVLNCGFVMWV